MSTATASRVALDAFSVQRDGDMSVRVELDGDLRVNLSRAGIGPINAENGVVLISLSIDGEPVDDIVLDAPGGPRNKTSVESLRCAREAIELALTAYE